MIMIMVIIVMVVIEIVMILIVVTVSCVIRMMIVMILWFCNQDHGGHGDQDRDGSDCSEFPLCDQDDNCDRGDISLNRCTYVLCSTMLLHDNIPVVNEMIILNCGNHVLTEAITKANSKWKKIFMFQKPW